MAERKVGVWIVGALGSIASTLLAGALAMRQGMADSRGMVTTTEPFAGIGLADVGALEFGGCDVRKGSLKNSVCEVLATTGAIPGLDLNRFEEDLARIERSIRPGTLRNCGQAIRALGSDPVDSCLSLREEISTIISYLDEFKSDFDLDEVVVVNLASTEPMLQLDDFHQNLQAFESQLDINRDGAVRAGTIYAYAAIACGCPYINFTPSNGALFPAMVQLAEAHGVPVMGNDGKTGETLIKSALAPMFTCRDLEVLSWEGFNILGNLDGRILDNPENRESKIKTKDKVLSQILGYAPHTSVHIDYVPSLSDQKTAWDFIHFRGFLGAKMSLQFLWQGYDSLLAAPLVLDLVRLADLAKVRGESGLMRHLACFFKDPLEVNEHGLYEQFQLLMEYASRVAGGSSSAVTK
jgi:myo-inositol-1-phosphate synthase